MESYTEMNFFDETLNSSSTSPQYDTVEIVPDDSYAFIFVPFAVLATVLLLSMMVR